MAGRLDWIAKRAENVPPIKAMHPTALRAAGDCQIVGRTGWTTCLVRYRLNGVRMFGRWSLGALFQESSESSFTLALASLMGEYLETFPPR